MTCSHRLTSIVCRRTRNELTYSVPIGASSVRRPMSARPINFPIQIHVELQPLLPAAQMRLERDPSPKARLRRRRARWGVLSGGCLSWVELGSGEPFAQSPLHHDERTSSDRAEWSISCHRRTPTVQPKESAIRSLRRRAPGVPRLAFAALASISRTAALWASRFPPVPEFNAT
jgi:hypothetical protein